MVFFWRYVPANKIKNLMGRHRVMVPPEASERVCQRALLTAYAHHMTEELKSIAIGSRESMRSAKCEGGRISRRAFEKLMDILRPGDAIRQPPPAGSTEKDGDAIMAIALLKGAKATPAKLAMNSGVDAASSLCHAVQHGQTSLRHPGPPRCPA